MSLTGLVCVATSLLVGCGASTTTSSGYNSALADRLGEAATGLRSAITADGAPSESPQFDQTQRRQFAAIFRGDLKGLTVADIRGLEGVQQRGLAASEQAARTYTKRARAMQAYRVDLSDPRLKASADVRTFVGTYNHLVDRAVALQQVNRADLQIAVRSNRDTVEALGAVRRGLQTGRFGDATTKLRRAAQSISELYQASQKAMARPSQQKLLNSAAAPLVDQANHSKDVSALVKHVADRYPSSVLTDVLRPEFRTT